MYLGARERERGRETESVETNEKAGQGKSERGLKEVPGLASGCVYNNHGAYLFCAVHVWDALADPLLPVHPVLLQEIDGRRTHDDVILSCTCNTSGKRGCEELCYKHMLVYDWHVCTHDTPVRWLHLPRTCAHTAHTAFLHLQSLAGNV